MRPVGRMATIQDSEERAVCRALALQMRMCPLGVDFGFAFQKPWYHSCVLYNLMGGGEASSDMERERVGKGES